MCFRGRKYQSLHLYCYSSTLSLMMDTYGYSLKGKQQEKTKTQTRIICIVELNFLKNVHLYISCLCSFSASLVGKEHWGIKMHEPWTF